MDKLVFIHSAPSAERKKYRLTMLAELAICLVPSGALFYNARPALSAQYLFAALGFFLLLHAFKRQPDRFTVLVVGVIPFVMILRTQYFFSGLVASLAGAMALWALFETAEFWHMMRSPIRLSLLVLCTIYWALSYWSSGQYSSNIHTLELAEAAVCVFMLGRERSRLTTALIGVALTTAVVTVAAWNFGERLGMLTIDSLSFGNPILLGLPAALIMILGIVDGGAWLELHRHPIARWVVVGAAAFCLMSTTSRGSWVVASACLIVTALVSHRDRKIVLGAAIAVLPLVVLIALGTSRGASVGTFFDRATSSKRNAAQLTTGRATMWAALPTILAEEPVMGFGPGSGVAVMREFLDKDKMWHALYLQVIVEAGLPGLLYLIILASVLMIRGFGHFQLTDEIVPLIGIVGYLLIGVSVSAIDALSGLYLGLGLLGGELDAYGSVRGSVVPSTAMVLHDRQTLAIGAGS